MDTRIPSLVPEQFGPLQGVRILSTGTIVAQPFAASLAADMGAEVIHVERPKEGDIWRQLGRPIPLPGEDGGTASTTWVQEHRNTFCVTLDMSTAEGKDLFLQLVSHADIWMESSKAGTYDRWGLDDETVLATNPALVITHVSGYGQTGHPDYLGRASYDVVGQAFGGMMHLNGSPDPEPPLSAAPLSADYITALYCLWSSLAGYIHAQRTGRGQVIDLAQYEAIHHILSGTMTAYYELEVWPETRFSPSRRFLNVDCRCNSGFLKRIAYTTMPYKTGIRLLGVARNPANGFPARLLGIVLERAGHKGYRVQPFGAYRASDGWVIIAAVGTVFDKVCSILGLDSSEAKWRLAATEAASVEGVEFDAILSGWVEERTVQEVEEIMNASQVACCPIMSARDMAENPHYRARELHIEWDDVQLGRKVKGVGFTPKFSETPGKVWRGSVSLGHDNDLIYGHYLGLRPDELEELRETGTI